LKAECRTPAEGVSRDQEGFVRVRTGPRKEAVFVEIELSPAPTPASEPK